LIKIFYDLTINQNNLKQGYTILSKYEKHKGFYFGTLQIIFTNLTEKNLIKLCCSAFSIFIKKIWNIEEYIDEEEKLVKIIFQFLIFLLIVSCKHTNDKYYTG